MRVAVVHAWPEGAEVVSVQLPDGATVADAIAAAGMNAPSEVGIYGKRVTLEHPVREGDRVEIYRPLLVDPKEARRRRARPRR